MLDHPDEVAEDQDAIQNIKYDSRVRQSSLKLRITTDMSNPSVYNFPQWFFNKQGDNGLKEDEQFLCSWAPQEGRSPQRDSEQVEERVGRSNEFKLNSIKINLKIYNIDEN